MPSSLTSQGWVADELPRNEGFSKISPSYRFFIPGTQFPTSGNAKDRSGKSADAIIMGPHSDANTWTAAGYFSSAAGTGLGLYVPNAKSSFDIGTQSVIFSVVMNAAAPGANAVLCGNGDAVTAQGFYLSHRATTGKLRPVLNTTGGVVTGLADSAATFGDATDHVVTLAIDASSKSLFLYRDGALSNAYLQAYTGTTTPVGAFAFGASADSTGVATTAVGKYRGAHLLVFSGPLPVNMDDIAVRLAAAPLLPLRDAEIDL